MPSFYFFSLSPISAPLLSIETFSKLQQTLKKKKKENRQINTVQHHICNTRFRKKSQQHHHAFLNRTLDIYALS